MTPEELMRLALSEAQNGGRAVRPNPRVGAALQSVDGRVVTGFHAQCGGPHAEASLLADCVAQGVDPRGGRLAVTLEPCTHFGRTPPCVEALLRAGVADVHVGVTDPNPLVSGQGLRRLREAGVRVEEGVLAAECEALNREWLAAQRQGRSFVTAKLATSLDGLWTAERGASQWITGPEAREKGHELRARVDALITGAGTVRADNPRFTARFKGVELPEQPEVFVLSKTQALDLQGTRLAGRARSLVVDDLKAWLGQLHQQGMHDVMLEAGPRLTQAFLAQGLVDELWLFLGPRFLGGQGLRLPALAGGELPGLEFDVLSSELLPGSDLFVKLAPSTLTLT